MAIFDKTIFTGFAPNLTRQDLKTASNFLFLPNNWPKLRLGDNPSKVDQWLKDFFQTKYSYTYDSGRSALYFALKALNVGENDEVLVQSFTCVVVINAIKWLGAKPIYVDINSNFNMDTKDLKKKITNRCRVLIIQHTFGRPADLDNLINIAKENNLRTIEDCAHAFGSKYNDKLLGTFGDIGMYSFGSDKILSCVRGGALTTNDSQVANILLQYQSNLPLSPRKKIIQHLLNIIFFSICKPIYNFGVGKWILALVKKLNIINRIVYPNEKLGLPTIFYPAKFPNSLAKILLDKLNILNDVISHQKEIASLYNHKISNPNIIKPEWSDDSIWLRYTILVDDPARLHKMAKDKNIILGNWYDSPVAASSIDLELLDYKTGTCPNDERLSRQCLNLPTDINISLNEVDRIVNIINSN